jgi:hypothetical protein
MGGSAHLWNVGLLQRDYTALYPRRLSSSYSPPWEPEMSKDIPCFYETGRSIIVFTKHPTRSYLEAVSLSTSSHRTSTESTLVSSVLRLRSPLPPPWVFTTKMLYSLVIRNQKCVLSPLHSQSSSFGTDSKVTHPSPCRNRKDFPSLNPPLEKRPYFLLTRIQFRI